MQSITKDFFEKFIYFFLDFSNRNKQIKIYVSSYSFLYVTAATLCCLYVSVVAIRALPEAVSARSRQGREQR